MTTMLKARCACILGVALAVSSCGTSGGAAKEARTSEPSLERDVLGKTWALEAVHWPDGGLAVNRAGNQQPDVYTLVFAADGTLSGKAAPNRYHGPYAAGEGSALAIGPNLASTRMLGLSASPGIREDEYYRFLALVSAWRLRDDGALVLESATEDGHAAEMLFREAAAE